MDSDFGGECGCGPGRPIIVQGNDKVLTFTLISRSTRQPFNISAATQISVIMDSSNEAGFIEKTLTGSPGGVAIINGASGIMTCTWTETETADMIPGLNSAEVRVTIGGLITTAQFFNAISVSPELFPGS